MTVSRTVVAAWKIAEDRTLPLNHPQLMGILNVTPDSFFDGGRLESADAAVNVALRMIDEGASIIDIGGESTRPGAAAVSPQEQIRRTRPVIESLRGRSGILISIDTTSGEVAQAALDAGANIINDVSAGLDDDRMLPLAASRGCGIVLMHRLRKPGGDRYSHEYTSPPDYGGDVVVAVKESLVLRAAAAMQAGIAREAIVLDPGLGFGKNVRQNYELVSRFNEICALGFPVLGAASRKSFTGAADPARSDPPPPPEDRLPGTLGVHLLLWQQGAGIFRVHDVAAHRQLFSAAMAGTPRAFLPGTGVATIASADERNKPQPSAVE